MSEIKKIKPSLSKGTRDFLPSEVAKRNYIFDTIKGVFRKYGFEEIETPAIESLETLEGKYGDEGDKLLFKIRSNRNIRTKFSEEKAKALDAVTTDFLPDRSDRGLRYDLTVPLARYVVMHQDQLAFPFKRFHLGPVWRGDNPQKGRYQEFYQCDADIIGSTSLLNEVELTKIYLEVFEKLEMDVTVQINNRKILWGIGLHFGVQDRFQEFISIMDKLDKIQWGGVLNELVKAKIKLHIGQTPLEEKDYMDLSEFREGIWQYANNWNQLREQLYDIFGRYGGHALSDLTKEGINDIHYIGSHFDYKSKIIFNPYLVRGLDYYTGTIWEIIANNIQMGSIASGGRYDNLTEMFGGQNMSGVGISFGIERIYDVMEELNLFPATITQGVKVLFVPRDETAEEFAFQQAQTLRDAGISAEIFLGNVKKQKHFNYVEQKNISYLVEIGGNEMESKKFRLRNAKTRETESDLTIEEIMGKVKG